MDINFCYSYRKSDIEYLIRQTDSFTWEELPTRDPDTGMLTQAAYVPLTETMAACASVVVYGYHMTQSTVRIVTSRDMIYPAWLPFDASVSPVYEIVIIVQVIRNGLTNFRFI
jgi:hypothetical protein